LHPLPSGYVFDIGRELQQRDLCGLYTGDFLGDCGLYEVYFVCAGRVCNRGWGVVVYVVSTRVLQCRDREQPSVHAVLGGDLRLAEWLHAMYAEPSRIVRGGRRQQLHPLPNGFVV